MLNSNNVSCMTSSLNRTHLATLHDSQSPSGFGADKTIAVVHDCVYCYIFRNTRASTTCAGYPGKLGTFRHSMSCQNLGGLLSKVQRNIRVAERSRIMKGYQHLTLETRLKLETLVTTIMPYKNRHAAKLWLLTRNFLATQFLY